MFKYDNSISADNVLGSVGYRELTKMINHIARKCRLKKEVVAEKGIVNEIHLRYIKNNETVDTLSLHFDIFEEERVIIITTTHNPDIGELYISDCMEDIWVWLKSRAENIVQYDYMTEVYNQVCKKAEKLSILVSCKFAGHNGLIFETYDASGKKNMLNVMYRLDYNEDIYGNYGGSICIGEKENQIEIANDKISFLVNACMFNLKYIPYEITSEKEE